MVFKLVVLSYAVGGTGFLILLYNFFVHFFHVFINTYTCRDKRNNRIDPLHRYFMWMCLKAFIQLSLVKVSL